MYLMYITSTKDYRMESFISRMNGPSNKLADECAEVSS